MRPFPDLVRLRVRVRVRVRKYGKSSQNIWPVGFLYQIFALRFPILRFKLSPEFSPVGAAISLEEIEMRVNAHFSCKDHQERHRYETQV